MYNYRLMRIQKKFSRLAGAIFAFAVLATALGAQGEHDLDARKRLFPQLGVGVLGVKRGPQGRYYVLTPRSVQIFGANETKVGEIPPPRAADDKSPPAISYSAAFDLDSEGRVYVADRGANALRVFSATGSLLLNIPFNTPTGIAAFTGGEFAATRAGSDHLVTVFDLQGKALREFGDAIAVLDDSPAFNRILNTGRLVSDPGNNLYFLFNFFPEPTYRKFDRFGYAAGDITLNTLEFAPAAEAERREIKRQVDAGSMPSLKEAVSCLGVDAKTHEVWVAISDELVVVSDDGVIGSEYIAHTSQGARLAPNSIVVEDDRVIVSSDPLGIYELPKTNKPAAAHP
jgi:hypothetical protein